MWSAYPDSKPETSGYYYTEYYNSEQDGVYLKAIWYDTESDEWCKWRMNLPDLEVRQFVRESLNPYYVPCEMWAREHWEELSGGLTNE